MQLKSIKTLIFVLSISLLAGGCVDMARIQQLEATAADALERANDAYRLAQTANTTASEAAYSAKEAEDLASAALSCCNQNASKFDRMFEKAVLK